MDILSEKGKLDWNRFVVDNNGSFLQSWEWGEFQKSLGREIWRLGGNDEWVAMIVRHDLPFGKSYLYCPGGPTIVSSIKYNVLSIIEKFLNEAKKIAEGERAIFLKIESFDEIKSRENGSPDGEPFSQYWADAGFIESDGGQRIKKTLVLDLSETEEELLAEMKQKTRYNIKVAEKHEVKIRISSDLKKDFEEFWRLMQATAERDNIKSHPREHYEKLFSLCHPEPQAKDLSDKDDTDNEILHFVQKDKLCVKLFLAEYQNKIVAANIVMFFGGTATYLHGASDYEQRHLMSPYLLQREQIKEAKKRGCARYDFWGLDEKKWPGVTRFKRGFGGRDVDYIGAWDYAFRPMWYRIYKIAKRLINVGWRKP